MLNSSRYPHPVPLRPLGKSRPRVIVHEQGNWLLTILRAEFSEHQIEFISLASESDLRSISLDTIEIVISVLPEEDSIAAKRVCALAEHGVLEKTLLILPNTHQKLLPTLYMAGFASILPFDVSPLELQEQLRNLIVL